MKSAAISHILIIFTAGALASVPVAGIVPLAKVYGHQDGSGLGKTKSMAGTQHEIVMLLIKKGDFEKAAAEADKIFAMKWPADQEPLLLSELLLLSNQFVRHKQPALSLRLIGRNSKCFKQTPSRIAILKEMGYVHKSMGEDEKAYDYFRQARELEDKD